MYLHFHMKNEQPLTNFWLKFLCSFSMCFMLHYVNTRRDSAFAWKCITTKVAVWSLTSSQNTQYLNFCKQGNSKSTRFVTEFLFYLFIFLCMGCGIWWQVYKHELCFLPGRLRWSLYMQMERSNVLSISSPAFRREADVVSSLACCYKCRKLYSYLIKNNLFC